MPEKRYIIPLSNTDRMIIRQDRTGQSIIEFSVQLEILIAGRWHKATRFDSSHGQPHRHVFYPNGEEYIEVMSANNNNLAFTESQDIINTTFPAIHERYIAYLEKMVQ